MFAANVNCNYAYILQVYCLTTGLMRYIKLVSMMLVVAHWNGCLHFLVPMLQDFPKSCWVARGGLQVCDVALAHLELSKNYRMESVKLFKGC